MFYEFKIIFLTKKSEVLSMISIAAKIHYVNFKLYNCNNNGQINKILTPIVGHQKAKEIKLHIPNFYKQYYFSKKL